MEPRGKLILVIGTLFVGGTVLSLSLLSGDAVDALPQMRHAKADYTGAGRIAHIDADERNPPVLQFEGNITRRMSRGRPIDKTAEQSNNHPPTEYEHIKRKIDNGVTEIWYYMSAHLNELMEDLDNKTRNKVERILENAGHQKRSILTDIYNLSRHDNYDKWRKQESEDLKQLVKKRLHYLQNPENCSQAKKIVCNKYDHICGFSCNAHRVANCLLIAYATNRTFVFESKGWQYSVEGWESVFQPLSDTCTTIGDIKAIAWTDPSSRKFQEAGAVRLPPYRLNPSPHYFPLAIPMDLSERLIRIHGFPFVWWFGQFMTYVMRPNDAMAYELEQANLRLGFKHPIVGVHVRRTDKLLKEAEFHSIEEYMVHVEEFYLKLERREEVTVKRVYLATDDDNLLAEAEEKYPDYEFLSDTSISKAAALGSRYSELGLKGIVTDVNLLSQCDFIVCTLSSTICRNSYALMQDLHVDASSYVHSIDSSYFFAGQNAHHHVAIYPHEAQGPEEISFQPGDLISVKHSNWDDFSNHWDGYSKGGLGQMSGLYPSYKAESKVEIAEMPNYKEVDEM